MQTHIALFKVGNCSHNLLVSGILAGFLQLDSQVGQLFSVGSVVICHIGHQCHQLLHGSVLTAGLAAFTAAGAVVAVIVMMMRIVEVVVGVGMGVTVFVVVAMLVAVGNTVVGVLVGMAMGMAVAVIAVANVIMILMHKHSP